MTKKTRIEFSHAELQALIAGLRTKNDPEIVKITDKFSKRALKNVLVYALEAETANKSLYEAATDVDAIVIEFVAAVSGLSTDKITPETTIDELNLSPQKLDYLRMNLNVWIKEKGGKGKISTAEMNAAKTVQDIIDLVNSKF